MRKISSKIFLSFLLIICSINAKSQQTENDQTKEIIYGLISEGFRVFGQNGKMGIMDKDNNILVQPIYDLPDGMNNNLLHVFKESRCMFFEKKTDPSTQEEYTYYGFLNEKFEKVIPAIYKYDGFFCDGFPSQFSNGRAIVKDNLNDSYVLIDLLGNRISNSFDYFIGCTAACYYFPCISEGLVAAINSNQKMGYINANSGNIAIPYNYSLAGPFSEGLAAVEVNEQFIIIIDKNGNQKFKKKFYTTKSGRKKSSEKNDPYSPPNGCNHLGGFVNGKMIINYYDNNGTGPMVYALIDKNGTVLIKKITTINNPINIDEDKDFKNHQWKF